jgi:hypothetical protein
MGKATHNNKIDKKKYLVSWLRTPSRPFVLDPIVLNTEEEFSAYTWRAQPHDLCWVPSYI